MGDENGDAKVGEKGNQGQEGDQGQDTREGMLKVSVRGREVWMTPDEVGEYVQKAEEAEDRAKSIERGGREKFEKAQRYADELERLKAAHRTHRLAQEGDVDAIEGLRAYKELFGYTDEQIDGALKMAREVGEGGQVDGGLKERKLREEDLPESVRRELNEGRAERAERQREVARARVHGKLDNVLAKDEVFGHIITDGRFTKKASRIKEYARSLLKRRAEESYVAGERGTPDGWTPDEGNLRALAREVRSFVEDMFSDEGTQPKRASSESGAGKQGLHPFGAGFAVPNMGKAPGTGGASSPLHRVEPKKAVKRPDARNTAAYSEYLRSLTEEANALLDEMG